MTTQYRHQRDLPEVHVALSILLDRPLKTVGEENRPTSYMAGLSVGRSIARFC